MSFKTIGSKKRSGSCPPIDQGGSLQTDNGCKTVVTSNCSESVHVNDCANVTEVASENDASRNPVCTRVFTNSNLSTRVVNALMARGNKYKTLNNMKCNNVAGQKISQVTNSHHIDQCQFKTKVFRNSAICSEKKNNDHQGQEWGHWSVKNSLETDQCPQSRETVVSQNQSKITTESVSDNKNHTSVGIDTLNESVVNDTNKALLFDINGIDEDKFVTVTSGVMLSLIVKITKNRSVKRLLILVSHHLGSL